MKQNFTIMLNKKINRAFYLKASFSRGVIELDVSDTLKAQSNNSFIKR